MGCAVPSTNRSLKLVKFNQQEQHVILLGLLSMQDMFLKNQSLILKTVTKHSKVVINALTNAEDFEPYQWKSSTKNTQVNSYFSSRDYEKSL